MVGKDCDGQARAAVPESDEPGLPEGDVIVAVETSSVTDKDGPGTGPGGWPVRISPHGQGIAFAGVTGRPETVEFLKSLSAAQIVPREEPAETVKRPLETETWGGGIDAVGGCMLARVLRQIQYCASVAAVTRAPGTYWSGARTGRLLNLVDFDWRAHLDHVERVDSELAYRLSMAMSRLGVLAGPTSGMALAGLLHHLQKVKDSRGLDDLRNSDGDVLCVFPCPDGPFPYLDEYPKYVAASEFPRISNEDALVNKSQTD